MEQAFEQCVAEVAHRGAAVLLSSHILAEVEKLCDTVTIIRAGRTVQSGSLAQLRHLMRTTVTVRTRGQAAEVLDWPGVHDADFARRAGPVLGGARPARLDDGPVDPAGHRRFDGHPGLCWRTCSCASTRVRGHDRRGRSTPSCRCRRASPFTGLAALVRFAIRRDRVRLSVWISVLTLMMVYAPNGIRLAYPEEAQRQARVNLLKTPAGIMLGGPMFGGNQTDLGVMMANELMLTLIVAASILAILTVIRHTRAEEESGAAELVLSSVVGRHARTAAAVIVMAAVNATLAITMTAAMAATGFAVVDTAAMCLGITAVATVFGALGGGYRPDVAAGPHRDRRGDGRAGRRRSDPRRR